MRPQLAPGLHVLRRGDERLQVGLDRRRAVLLPDTDDVRRNLTALVRGEVTSVAQVPAQVRPLLDEPARRLSARVAVIGFGHSSGDELVPRLRQLVAASGLTVGRSVADVKVLAGVGEPDRALLDQCGQSGTPHLLVRLVEGHAVVGPFVAPGRTACLRCLDATATDEDPAWPLLVQQYVSLSARDRLDGATEPVDPVLAVLACAWAVRDVTTYVQGHRPSTWSTTVRLDPLLQEIGITEWLRHPACGCSWTMEA
jgi:bacteriocin biosynthesis cyclodehydratase domain-containing protein